MWLLQRSRHLSGGTVGHYYLDNSKSSKKYTAHSLALLHRGGSSSTCLKKVRCEFSWRIPVSTPNSLRTMALSNLRYAGILVCILFVSDARCAIEAKCPNTERLKSLRCAVIGSGAVGITLAGCRPPVCPLACHRVRSMLAIDHERNSC